MLCTWVVVVVVVVVTVAVVVVAVVVVVECTLAVQTIVVVVVVVVAVCSVPQGLLYHLDRPSFHGKLQDTDGVRQWSKLMVIHRGL